MKLNVFKAEATQIQRRFYVDGKYEHLETINLKEVQLLYRNNATVVGVWYVIRYPDNTYQPTNNP